MLVSLKIRDLALAEDLLWTPTEGYNTVTGETGAGKSILVGAITLALGARADKSQIRHGAETAIVEAVFEINNSLLKKHIFEILDQAGIEHNDEPHLILKRTLTSSGTSRQWINGNACTLQLLRTVGEKLVDFHGPHDQQSLLSPTTHRQLLDAYAQAQPLCEEVTQAWRRWQQAEKHYQQLQSELEQQQHRIELLKEQVHEIEAANPQPQEDEYIATRLKTVAQAHRLAEICQMVICEIEDNPDSIQSRLKKVHKLLGELQKIDEGATALHMLNCLESLQLNLQELLQTLTNYSQTIPADPETLQQLTERYNLLQLLKKKYGPTLQEVIAYYQNACRQLTRFHNKDHELTTAHKECEQAQAEYFRAAKRLSNLRKNAAANLQTAITQHLRELNFPHASLSVQLTETPPHIHGLEHVEFFFSPNPGEGSRPLKDIASSGEMARVMLAIKTCLASQDQTPLLIFDEVDANIGGTTAVEVAKKLRHLGKTHQVLCITHLPQVAAAAQTHFLVTKEIHQNRTKISVTKIENQQRTAEIIRMLGGSAKAKQLAESLLSQT